MKIRLRKPSGKTWLLPSAFIALMASVPFSSFAQDPQRHADFERLVHKAWETGKVGIIVHLDVPHIKELTAASINYLGIDENAAIAAERSQADNALKEAIAYAAWRSTMWLQGTEFDVNAIYQSIPYMALRVSANALILLEESPIVVGIEEDFPIRLIDPVENQSGAKGPVLLNDGGDIDGPSLNTSVDLIGAKTAWNWGYTGSGWYVAILDTGIRRTHQFFRGKTIVEGCFALGSDGAAGVGDCPNGTSSMFGTGAAAHHSSTYSGYDHGTHVSGIAAGNYGSLAGVAKNANIIAIQVFSKFAAGTCGGSPCVLTWSSDVLSGLDYIYSIRGGRKIAAVNLSLGSGIYSSACNDDSRKTAIDNLRSVGIGTCIATGNSSSCTGISAPACISSSVAVGSSTKSDAESYFNNWHATLQKLFAPGSSIYSSTGSSDSSYASWSGTSMATPHVTGAWALMKQSIPTGTVTKFLNALRSTGVSIYSICDSYDAAIPRIRVDKAIASIAAYTLTVQTSSFGTTNPTPGAYSYTPGTQVQITATPDTNCEFVNWTGSISSTQNPVTVTMDGDKTIKANFRVKPKLTLESTANGTTNPVPGIYYYSTGTQVQITAIPGTYFAFVNWSGSASGSDNPLNVIMNSDKTIKANFRYIYEPIAAGKKVLNRTFSQAEYIDILSWQANPSNEGLDIAKYRIYQILNGASTLLAELNADQFEYTRRNAGQGSTQYLIAAVTRSGSAGAPAQVTVQ